MNKLLLFLAFLSCFSRWPAQSYPYLNASTGNTGQSFTDKDTNLYLYHANRLEKYNKNLVPAWAKTYSGINFQSVLISKSGSFYFLTTDSIFGKLDKNGNISWVKAVYSGTTLAAASQATISNTANCLGGGTIFLDRNNDLILTGALQVSGFSSPNSLFLKCDTSGNFKKAALIGSLFYPSITSLRGTYDSSGYYKLLFDYVYPPGPTQINNGILIMSDFADSVIRRIDQGGLSSSYFSYFTYKSKFNNVYYRIMSFSAGPNNGLYVSKYRNNCKLWYAQATYPAAYAYSNFDEDESGNTFFSLSKSYQTEGFFRLDSSGNHTGGFEYSYSGYAYKTKTRVVNYNNYFIDGYGISSNPLLIGRFDSALAIPCTSTLGLTSYTGGVFCGSSGSLPRTYTLSGIPFTNVATTMISVPGFTVNSNFCVVLNVSEKQASNELIIYPNPTTGRVFLRKGNISENNIKILNSLGKEINFQISEKQNSDYLEIDLSDNQKGIYLLKAGNTTSKIILE